MKSRMEIGGLALAEGRAYRECLERTKAWEDAATSWERERLRRQLRAAHDEWVAARDALRSAVNEALGSA